MKKVKHIVIGLVASLVIGCGTVDVTKTGAGYFDPTSPSSVEILRTKPERSYVELGTVDVSGFTPRDTAKMHNAVRTKAAPLGANAVIITDENMVYQPYVGMTKYASGVAIRYK